MKKMALFGLWMTALLYGVASCKKDMLPVPDVSYANSLSWWWDKTEPVKITLETLDDAFIHYVSVSFKISNPSNHKQLTYQVREWDVLFWGEWVDTSEYPQKYGANRLRVRKGSDKRLYAFRIAYDDLVSGKRKYSNEIWITILPEGK